LWPQTSQGFELVVVVGQSGADDYSSSLMRTT